MIWLLLFASTALVVLLPMLPAILEWHRPRDPVPLHIDAEDALDPPFLARSFGARLAAALAAGQTQLGRSPIADAPPFSAWPLNEGEQRAESSRRVWHTAGDAELPSDISFLAEVAARGTLRTAAGGVYRALLAGRLLELAPRSNVLRWAHGARVDVGPGCNLTGRVSADESITVTSDTSFTLLHAPSIRFVPARPGVIAASPSVVRLGLPEAVVWDAAAARGTCDEPLDVGAHRAWRGDLVCRADLSLGMGCNAQGSLKAHGNISVAAGSMIGGSVVAEGSIALGAECAVRGSVISESAIELGSNCVIGAPDRPATVAAPSITVAPGVIVHGTLWAGQSGRTESDATAHEMAVPGAGALPAAVREATA